MGAEEVWLRTLLRRRTRALHRVIDERDEFEARARLWERKAETYRLLITKAAHLERVGWAAHKLHAQGDAPVRPSAIITIAEGDHHQ